MDIYHVIRRPLVTEKGTHQAQLSHAATRHKAARGGSYAFEVHPDANKAEIKQAIEKIYNVKVQAVRTANRKGKPRRARFRFTETRAWKRAVVVLQADAHIDLF